MDSNSPPEQEIAPQVQPVSGVAMRGRQAEWRIISNLLRRTQRGPGGVLLVDGEWGIGKSLLLAEAAREASKQYFSLAVGVADPLGRHMPFFALLTALHEPVGKLGAEDSGPDTLSTYALLARIRARLEQRAAASPVLVSVDNLQWASPATLMALRTLPRELARQRVAWIFSRSYARQEEDAKVLFGVLEGGGATRITLAPLDDDSVVRVLTDGLGAPPDEGLVTLASGAAGNPLLLTELIQGLREECAVDVTGGQARLISAQLPQRIQLVARQRFDDLSSGAWHLLETAAVVGRRFRLDDAADMLGETPASLLPAVEEAVTAGVLDTSEDSFSFRHELVWHAARHMVSPSARRALHRQYGEILLSHGGPAATAAAHLLESAASNDSAALTGLDRAVTKTLNSHPQTAAEMALRALELTRSADSDTLSRSVAAAEALVAAGRMEHASRIAHDAFAQPLPAILEARLRCVLSLIRCSDGQAHEASSEAQTVLAHSGLPRSILGEAMIAQLRALAALRDNHTAGLIAATILASPDEYGDEVVTAAATTRAMISWDKGQTSAGLELLRQAARRCTAVSPDARHFQPLVVLAAALVDLRVFDEADILIRALDTEALHGLPAQAGLAILRARQHLAMGGLNEAAAQGEAAQDIARDIGAHSHRSVACCVLGMVALRRGDLSGAEYHIASRPVRTPHIADTYARTQTTMAEAQITEARYGAAAAMDQIHEVCIDLPDHPGLLVGEPAIPSWLVRTALAAGDPQLAASIARISEDLARGGPDFPVVVAAAAHSVGLVSQDPARLAQAVSEHQDPWARASAAEDLGVLLATHGDEGQAIQYLDNALDGYRLGSAAIDLARIRRRLRKLGVRRRHWTPEERPVTGWESLTEAERATSALVAQGLTNRQVASRMYVSASTVAFHLRQIFLKLGISSRVELARIVVEQTQQSGPGTGSHNTDGSLPALPPVSPAALKELAEGSGLSDLRVCGGWNAAKLGVCPRPGPLLRLPPRCGLRLYRVPSRAGSGRGTARRAGMQRAPCPGVAHPGMARTASRPS